MPLCASLRPVDNMAMRTLPAVTYSAPVALPTVGYGGSYYDTPAFKVPTYGASTSANFTWRFIEDYARVLVNKSSTEGIAAGITWATFIYLLALTPNQKRTSPFQTRLLLGLAFYSSIDDRPHLGLHPARPNIQLTFSLLYRVRHLHFTLHINSGCKHDHRDHLHLLC